jgi:hypothetical protein
MDLGARKNLISYLQPWSESMALASSISWISPLFPKTRKEIIKFRKNLF